MNNKVKIKNKKGILSLVTKKFQKVAHYTYRHPKLAAFEILCVFLSFAMGVMLYSFHIASP